MAQVTNTYSSYDTKGNREDLQDKIYNISPTETPFQANIETIEVKATKHEWQTDALAAASSNAQIEGDEFAYTAPTATTRVGNYTQISRKAFLVSRTAESIRKAGRKSEIALQLAKNGKELKRDIETDLTSKNASVAGDDTTARKSGGVEAWLTSNDSRGAGGAQGGYNAGTGVVDTVTDGTQRAFSEALLKDAQQLAYTSGGTPAILMVGPFNKRQFSSFSGVAELRREAGGKGQATIVGAADMYIGDFGPLGVVTNRLSRDRTALLLDTEYAKVGWLDRISHIEPAITGDAKKHVLIGEWTLIVGNEAAHAVVADLTTS